MNPALKTNLTPSSSRIEFISKDQAASYGQWRNILVVYGHSAPKMENAATYQRLMRTLVRQHPAGIGVITLIGDKTAPQPDAREALISAFTSLGDRVSAVFVLNSRGFATATQRAIITAILLATGRRNKMHVTGSVAEGLSWLEQRLADKGDKVSLVGLGSAIADFSDREGPNSVTVPKA